MPLCSPVTLYFMTIYENVQISLFLCGFISEDSHSTENWHRINLLCSLLLNLPSIIWPQPWILQLVWTRYYFYLSKNLLLYSFFLKLLFLHSNACMWIPVLIFECYVHAQVQGYRMCRQIPWKWTRQSHRCWGSNLAIYKSTEYT